MIQSLLIIDRSVLDHTVAGSLQVALGPDVHEITWTAETYGSLVELHESVVAELGATSLDVVSQGAVLSSVAIVSIYRTNGTVNPSMVVSLTQDGQAVPDAFTIAQNFQFVNTGSRVDQLIEPTVERRYSFSI